MLNQHLSTAIKKGSFLFGFLLYLLHKFKKPPFQRGVGGIFVNSATGLLIASILSNSPAQGSSITAEPSTGTTVNQSGSQFDIEGGTTSGSNLFHSFDKFGLETGETANFQTKSSVENILGRIVGGDPSIINGMIQVSGSNANLFLLNPAGIVFGAEASLNIMGDFTASTANGIGLGNGNWFYAIGNNDYTALTGTPSEFVFGSENGAIINYADLALNAGSNLTLLGSSVLSTGNLAAPGGQITVAAVPNSSLVRVGQTGHLLHLDIDTSSAPSIPASNLPAFTPVDLPGLLTGASEVGNAAEVTVNSDGNVVLTGSGLSVEDGELAVNNVDSSSSTGSGGAIALSANNNLIATGDIDAGSISGTGGEIALEAQEDVKLNVVASSGDSGGGDISIVSHNGAIDGLSLTSVPQTSGNGGDITLEAESSITIGQDIVTHSQYLGDAGNVNMISHNGDITVANEISTKAESNGGGQAGNVTLEAPNGAISIYGIDADSREAGNQAGDISIQARGNITATEEIGANARDNAKAGNIEITSTEGNLDIYKTEARIFEEDSVANGGSITLEATQGDVTTGQLWTDAYHGDAGPITVTAGGGIFFSNTDSGYIYARSRKEGNGGDVTLEAGGNIVTNGGAITTNGSNDGGSVSLTSDSGSITADSIVTYSSGVGDGGSISITALGDLEFAELFSGAFAGNGGDITLTSGGKITVNSGRLYQYFASNCGGVGAVNIQCNQDRTLEITPNETSSYPALTWFLGAYTGKITISKTPSSSQSVGSSSGNSSQTGDSSQTANSNSSQTANSGQTANSNSSQTANSGQTANSNSSQTANSGQTANSSQTANSNSGQTVNSGQTETGDSDNSDRSNDNRSIEGTEIEQEEGSSIIVTLELKEKDTGETESSSVTFSAENNEDSTTTFSVKNSNASSNSTTEDEDSATPVVTRPLEIGSGGNISASSSEGGIDINGQLNSSGRNDSGSNVTLTAQEDINVSEDIDTSSQTRNGLPPDFKSIGLALPAETEQILNQTNPNATGGNVSINRTAGNVDVGNINSFSDMGNGGSVQVAAQNDVATGNINTSSPNIAGSVSLASQSGDVTAGDINALGGVRDGAVTINAPGEINTGTIQSSNVSINPPAPPAPPPPSSSSIGGSARLSIPVAPTPVTVPATSPVPQKIAPANPAPVQVIPETPAISNLSNSVRKAIALPPEILCSQSSCATGINAQQQLPEAIANVPNTNIAVNPILNIIDLSTAPQNLAAANPAPVQVIPETLAISNLSNPVTQAIAPPPPEILCSQSSCPTGINAQHQPPQAIAYSNITRSNINTSPILTIIDPIAALRDGDIDKAVQEIEESFTREYLKSGVKDYPDTKEYLKSGVKDYPDTKVNVARIQDTLKDISQKNENIKPAVIYAIAKPEQLGLIMITAEDKVVNLSKVDTGLRQNLIDEVELLYSKVKDNNSEKSDYLKAGRKLYEELIKPLEAQLEEQGINTLIFSMDRRLRLLPLAALHDGQKFLIEKYNIALIPSVSLMDTSYVGIKNSPVLAMGADKFPHSGQDPLPFVSVELDTITDLLSGETFLNEAFTLDGLKDARGQQQFSIVHLATHASFDPEVSEEQNKNNEKKKDKNYIQFWDERVGLEELREVGWYNHSTVELLVLSACETALGDEKAEMGFAGLAVQAGVKSAVASLWKVSDAGTLGLMTEFYQNLNNAPSKAEALRLAQLAMLRGEVRIDDNKLATRDLSIRLEGTKSSKTNNVDLTHPYYWAAFTTIGSPW